jgi:hypothetical protein
MTPEQREKILSSLAFRAAMKKAFPWEFPLADHVLHALVRSAEFDKIFEQSQPTGDLSDKDREAQHFEAVANDPRVQLFVNEYLENHEQDLFVRRHQLVARLAFRAAMQKAFKWKFPLPNKALIALISSPEFDEIFRENRPATAVSHKTLEARHFEAIANDARVQLFVNEHLAKEKEGDYLRNLIVFFWRELQHAVRNWIRRLLNPQQLEASAKPESENPPPPRPAPRMRIPVFKTAVLALVSYAAYFLYQHKPNIVITMIAPREFPHLQIDSVPVKFDTAKVHFPDIQFRGPAELKVAKLQFGTPPQLQIAKLQFDTPPPLKFTSPLDVKLAPDSRILLDTNGSTIQIAQSGALHFDPLQIKNGSVIPLKFDQDIFDHPPRFQLNVNHRLDGLLSSNPGFRFSDKRQGFFWPSHTYTWELTSKSSPPESSPPTRANVSVNNNNRDAGDGHK